MLTIHPKLQPRWTKFLQKWAGCKLCNCSQSRTQIVHYRGYLPCDVLFIGEAPGDSEDAIGFPFVGPAGDLFNRMRVSAYRHAKSFDIEDTYPLTGEWAGKHLPLPTYGICNIVACRPKTPKTEFSSGGLREPTKEEALACQPRLVELTQMATPKLVVLLGKTAVKYAPSSDQWCTVHLMHPSAILRAELTRQATLEKRFVLSLAEALKQL